MNKYKNRKVKIDNISFDSQKEANKYCELMVMQRQGTVKSFICHPRFEIIPKFKKDETTYRTTYYVADFDVQYADGSREIIDIKPYNKSSGEYFLTPVFRLKAKLFDIRYQDLKLIIE